MKALRAPKPIYERLKLPLLIIAYVVASELASPLPFRQTLPAQVAFVLLTVLLIRELHHLRLETSESYFGLQTRFGRWLKSYTDKVSKQSWLRFQRIATWGVGLYAMGVMVNSLSTGCNSPPQCVLRTPGMVLGNLPQLFQFIILMFVMIAQLGVMFYAMVKVGSYKIVMPGTIGVSFDDVWGQDAAKQKVLEQVQLLDDSAHIEKAGGYMPKGLMLYGPPGTGKTYLAKAAASYSTKPLILVPPGAFQATFVGINLLKVWALFRSVRKLSRRYGGVIVFIDEIDSLGSRGTEVEGQGDSARKYIIGGGSGGNQMGTLEAFLSAMDGMEEPRGPLNRLLVFLGFKPLRPYEYKYLMMGATNRLNALDAALLRAGRFGRKIHVDFPTQEGRHKTYEGYLSKISHTLTPENVEWAARIHSRGTGAEIKDIVNEAVLITYRDDRKDEGTVTFDDVLKAMVWVKFGESEGPFKRPEAQDLVAIHEAGHAVAFALLMRGRQDIWFASIEQRASAGGMVVPTQIHEDWIMTKEEAFAELQVDLASRVAEQLLLGTTTNGHGGDGRNMTKRAEAMVAYGMGDTIGIYKQDKKQVEKLLREALVATEKLLKPKKKIIRQVADLLIERGTVAGDDIYAIVEGKS